MLVNVLAAPPCHLHCYKYILFSTIQPSKRCTIWQCGGHPATGKKHHTTQREERLPPAVHGLLSSSLCCFCPQLPGAVSRSNAWKSRPPPASLLDCSGFATLWGMSTSSVKREGGLSVVIQQAALHVLFAHVCVSGAEELYCWAEPNKEDQVLKAS